VRRASAVQRKRKLVIGAFYRSPLNARLNILPNGVFGSVLNTSDALMRSVDVAARYIQLYSNIYNIIYTDIVHEHAGHDVILALTAHMRA
jgi:hypothetical protein